MTQHYSYYCVSAPAGSGKTYAAIRHAVDLARMGEKVIIAQPSKLCIAEWHPKARDYAGDSNGPSVPVFRFDGDVCGDGQTLSSILAHMEAPATGGEVMFITHAALLSITYSSPAANELPEGVASDCLNRWWTWVARLLEPESR